MVFRGIQACLRKWLGALAVLTMLAGQPVMAGFDPAIGNYVNVDRLGTGLDVQRAGNTIFVLWFTYVGNGDPRWYLAVGELDGMNWSGDIFLFLWDGTSASGTVIGEMSLTWADEERADFAWTLVNDSGAWPVEFLRFAEGPTRVDHTGHYFSKGQSGWGASLLTQGTVTALFLYFYNATGQPIWLLGTSGNTSFSQTFTLELFNGQGLCPICGGDDKSFTSQAVVDVNIVDVPRLFTGNRGFDTVERLKTITHDPDSINPETPLGPNPLAPVDLPPDSGPDGPFQSLSAATPSTTPPFTEAELDVLMDSLTLDYDSTLFRNPAACTEAINQLAIIDVAENPNAYPRIKRPRGSAVLFGLDDFGISEPTIMAIRKAGDELLAFSWIGFWPAFGIQDGVTLVVPVDDFFENPENGLVIDQILHHQIKGIGSIFQQVVRVEDFGILENAPGRRCARLFHTSDIN